MIIAPFFRNYQTFIFAKYLLWCIIIFLEQVKKIEGKKFLVINRLLDMLGGYGTMTLFFIHKCHD